MDKIEKHINDSKIIDEAINSMTIKQNTSNYTFKYSHSHGDDYWTLHHYKTLNLNNVSTNEKYM